MVAFFSDSDASPDVGGVAAAVASVACTVVLDVVDLEPAPEFASAVACKLSLPAAARPCPVDVVDASCIIDDPPSLPLLALPVSPVSRSPDMDMVMMEDDAVSSDGW